MSYYTFTPIHKPFFSRIFAYKLLFAFQFVSWNSNNFEMDQTVYELPKCAQEQGKTGEEPGEFGWF